MRLKYVIAVISSIITKIPIREQITENVFNQTNDVKGGDSGNFIVFVAKLQNNILQSRNLRKTLVWEKRDDFKDCEGNSYNYVNISFIVSTQ